MKSVGWPVSKPGASKSMFLTSSSPGVPIGWTVSDSPSATTSPCSSPEPRGHGRGDQEDDQAGMGQQGRHLGVLVAVAVQEAGAAGVRRLADVEAVLAQDGPDAVRRHAVHRGAVGQDRVEEGLGLGDPDVADAAPQLGRPIERADDDRGDEDDQPGAEPGRAEDREQRQPLHDVHDRRPEDRVVAGVELVHRRRVVGRRAEGEVGQLLDRHPDDRQQGQEDDLEDREVDRREEVPQPVAHAGWDVPAGRSGGGRRDGGRTRDGSSP